MSLNQVLRYVGFAVGSALTATVLAACHGAGRAAPPPPATRVIAVIGFAVCLTTAAVTWLIPGRPPRPPRRPDAASSPSGAPGP